MTQYKKKKTPWPTKAAMEQVYQKKLWGDNNTPFYSGTGSHDTNITQEYIENLIVFLTSFKTKPRVLDLGCGDFNIGKQLVPYTSTYHAVDIVAPLIAYNKTQFTDPRITFSCLDIAKDALPKADIVIVRQVLQHISNAEIQAVLLKLYAFKYVVITEHIPVGDFTPNIDIISGQGIRLKKQSGVVLVAPPFSLKIKTQKQLCTTILEKNKGQIVTTLYEL